MEKKNVYETRRLAFFDILGFSNLIRKSAKDETLAQGVLDTFNMVKKTMEKTTSPYSSSTLFSDCFCMSQAASGNFYAFCGGLSLFVVGMIAKGYPVRGAISIGQLYHRDSVIFGPCLVRAYELESKLSNHPRIIIDPEINIEDDEESKELDLFYTDNDGIVSLNYLSPTLICFFSEFTGLFPPSVLIESIKKTIENLMGEFEHSNNPYAKAKIQWLHHYADRVLFKAKPDEKLIRELCARARAEAAKQPDY